MLPTLGGLFHRKCARVHSQFSPVKVIRGVSLDTKFSIALHEAIAQQMEVEISPQVYNNRVDQIYAKYPDTLSMVRDALCGGPL
jgi:hypothetical protein